MRKKRARPQDEYVVIYTRYITLKGGRRIFASNYGLKAFRLRVRRKAA